MQRRKFIATAALAAAMTGSLVTADAATAAPESGQRAGWTSTFNGSKAGWQDVVGNWVLKPGNLYNTGIAGMRTSVKHINNYTNFYYTVRMKRWGNSTGVAANAIVIRGNPSSRDGTGYWRPSYLLQYSNNGYYSVWRINADATQTAIQGWTPVSGVISKSGYNKLEVWAYGDSLDFHINGVHLWSGFDSALTFGNVGVSQYTEPGKWSQTWLDSASLTVATRVAPHDHGAAGTPVKGGTMDMAPR